MAGVWNPDPQFLEQALRDPTRSDHKDALASLDSDTANPDFILHLLEVFCKGGNYGGFTVDIRQLAGLIIKNYVFRHLGELNSEVFRVVKHEILQALLDTHQDIRNTAGILVGRICDAFSFESWSDIVEPLLELVQSIDPIHIDGALKAIKRMCEDACEKLNMDKTMRPLELIVPTLLNLFHSDEAVFRLRALESLNSLIFLMPAATDDSSSLTARQSQGSTPCAMVTHLQTFLAGLSSLAYNADGRVRRAVCQSIVLLASHQLAALSPLGSICEFMLQSISDQDEQVAMEACEFWWVLMESSDGCNFIVEQHMSTVVQSNSPTTPNNSPVEGYSLMTGPSRSHDSGERSFLGELIPSLIARLPLTETQIEFDRSEEEAEDSGEKEINFKPIHYNSRSLSRETGDEDGEGGGGENGEDASSTMWTIRREAARVLDVIACAVPAELTLSIALPVLQANLETPDVWMIEAGMLGLGALSRGCCDEMSRFLPDLLPFLLGSVNGTIGDLECPPELRCVAAWVIGRYSYFWFDGEDQGTRNIERQKDIMTCLLGCMLQGHPKFQAAACAALCAIFEICAGSSDDGEINILHVFLVDILRQVQAAFGIYGVKNTLILCDTLATLCDSLGEFSLQSANDADSSQALHQLFMPPLLEKFYCAINPSQSPIMSQAITSGGITLNPYVFPIMECITSVYPAVGREIAPYAQDIVKTCLYIMQAVLDANRGYMGEEGSPEPPSKDFLVCSLDVISGVVEGLGGNFAEVVLEIDLAVGGTNEMLTALLRQLTECLVDEDYPDVRQSAFSLLGDMVSKGGCVSLFFTPIADTPLPSGDDPGASLMNIPTSAPAGIAYTLQLCLLNMHPHIAQQSPLVTNNAVWAVGEMCLALGRDSSHVAPALANHIALLLISVSTPVSGMASAALQWDGETPVVLRQNLAISLGRLCMLCAEEVSADADSPVLSPDCLLSWCRALKLVQYSEEREQAFAGLIAILNRNPQMILSDSTSMEHFVLSCASWDQLPSNPDVATGIQHILMAVRVHGVTEEAAANGAVGQNWGRLMSRMDENTVNRIHQVFELPS